jgi:hypothetical protein
MFSRGNAVSDEPYDSPRDLESWCGWDLAAAVRDGRELLVASDGRTAALIPRATQAMAGDDIRVFGVTHNLRLASLIGAVDKHELWLTSSPTVWAEPWLVTTGPR